MQNGEKGEFKYRIEAARNLAREGIVTEPVTDDILHVTLGGKRLCWVTDRGNIGYYREDVAEEAAQVVLDRVRDVAQTTREYMTQLEQAPPLSASGLASEAGYGLLSEFNGIVLAGKITRYGAQFVTWEWVRERTGLYQGNYYGPDGGVNDYALAKRDFAVRSGLLPACTLFKQEQLAEVYRSIHKTLNGDIPLTDERRKALESVAAQIEEGVPDLSERVRLSEGREHELRLELERTDVPEGQFGGLSL